MRRCVCVHDHSIAAARSPRGFHIASPVCDRRPSVALQVSEELGRIGAGLNVITRNGSPNELNHIDRVAAGTARRIIVLPQADDADDEGESAKETTGLALALQRGLTKKQRDRAAVVVTAPTAEYSDEVAQDADGFGSYAEVKSRRRSPGRMPALSVARVGEKSTCACDA